MASQFLLLIRLLSFSQRQVYLTLFICSMMVFSVFASANSEPQAKIKQIAQLAEYIGVDYVSAVDNGNILNADEYQEMTEFSNVIVEQASSLSDQTDKYDSVKNYAHTLHKTIANKASVADVRKATTSLREALLTFMPQLSLPNSLLPNAKTKALFTQNCSMCHGLSGKGDGPLAKSLTPEPTNFTDKDRARNRSIMGLYDAISNGIDDTPMVAFSQFSDQQRWSLAFYVGSLAFQSVEQPAQLESKVTPSQIVNLNPSQITNNLSAEQAHYVDWLRGHPEHLFDSKKHPLAYARSQLLAAQKAYQSQNYDQASDLAISAYLDGFELVENNLNAYDEALRKKIEAQLMSLRNTLKEKANEASVNKQINNVLIEIDKADNLLKGDKLSNSALLWASLIILLREGLEALLVIIALMTVLIKTKRQDALKYVHLGWVTALIAGGVTWLVAQTLIEISGASREIMEGVGALLAAIILLYVGVWMHSKTSAKQWQAYIQNNISKRLESGTLWGLAGLSFIAVYREVFETVLFYQSLLTQSSAEQYVSVTSGFLIGAALLTLLGWALVKYSIKLPVAKFFAITTYILFFLSFVLMGKAITALQEADLVTISTLPFNIDLVWLGVKSTWQGIVAQTAVIIIFGFYILKSKK